MLSLQLVSGLLKTLFVCLFVCLFVATQQHCQSTEEKSEAVTPAKKIIHLLDTLLIHPLIPE